MALTTPLGYHYIPIASAWSRLLYLLFGDRERLYAIANIGQLALVGWLTFWFGRRLLGHPLAGLLAGGLLIGSAAFPDVTYWPLVGNLHCLAAAFAIGAVAAAFQLAEEGPPRGAAWGFAVALVGAVFTYEGTITLLPVAVVWCLVRSAEREGIRSLFRFDLLKGLLRRFAPTLPVVAALIFAQVRFAGATSGAIAPGLDTVRLHSLAQCLLGIFTLRGSYDVLEGLLRLGSTTALVDSRRPLLLIGSALVASVWIFRRAGRGTRLLMLWFWIHLAIEAVAVPLAPRHRFLPSIPGLLLLAFGFCRWGERLSRRIARAAPAGTAETTGTVRTVALSRAAVALGLPVLLSSILLFSAEGELHRAQELYRRSYDSLRLSVEQARALLPSREAPATVTLVNAPAYWADGGITAPAFENALGSLRYFRLRNAGLEVVHTWTGLPGWQATGGSRLVDGQELMRRIADPHRAVIALDHAPGSVRVLALDGLRMPEP
ncbi:MAG: hypothetical protein ABJC13_24710 [Acidobacteriota bacterium]